MFVGFLALLGTFAYATFFGSAPLPWSFIEATGGCAIGRPYRKGHLWHVEILYDVSGLTPVSKSHAVPNSMTSVHNIRVEADSSGRVLTLRFFGGRVSSIFPQRYPLSIDIDGNLKGEYSVVYADINGKLEPIGKVRLEDLSDSDP